MQDPRANHSRQIPKCHAIVMDDFSGLQPIIMYQSRQVICKLLVSRSQSALPMERLRVPGSQEPSSQNRDRFGSLTFAEEFDEAG